MLSKETTNEVFGQINKMMSYGAPKIAFKDLAALAPEPVAKNFVNKEVKLKSDKELRQEGSRK